MFADSEQMKTMSSAAASNTIAGYASKLEVALDANDQGPAQTGTSLFKQHRARSCDFAQDDEEEVQPIALKTVSLEFTSPMIHKEDSASKVVRISDTLDSQTPAYRMAMASGQHKDPMQTPVATQRGSESSTSLSVLLDYWVIKLETAYQKQLRSYKPLIEDSIRQHIEGINIRSGHAGPQSRESELDEAVPCERPYISHELDWGVEPWINLLAHDAAPPEHSIAGGLGDLKLESEVEAKIRPTLVAAPVTALLKKKGSLQSLPDSVPSGRSLLSDGPNRTCSILGTASCDSSAASCTSRSKKKSFSFRGDSGKLSVSARSSKASSGSAPGRTVSSVKEKHFQMLRTLSPVVPGQRSSFADSFHIQSTYRRSKSQLERHQSDLNSTCVRGCCLRVTNHLFFKVLSALLILSNAIFIGVQTHTQAVAEFSKLFQQESVEHDWGKWEIAFVVAFTMEIACRLVADQSRFVYGREWRWNLFDLIIVALSILEVVLVHALEGVGANLPVLRLVRVTRVVRILTVINMVKFFRHLSVMITSIFDSLVVLMPAFALLSITVYLFGIIILQGVVNDIGERMRDGSWNSSDQYLRERYGGVWRTMLTLAMSITNGISWKDGFTPLAGAGLGYQLIYFCYILFLQIGVLNIVTGIFVDTVHQMYKPEREDVIEREATKRRQIIDDLVELFMEADKDATGFLTWQKFEAHLSNESVQMLLESLQLDVSQAREAFDLMDGDKTGEVDVQEFVEGFLCLRGQAKSVDVWLLKRQQTRLIWQLEKFTAETKDVLVKLASGISVMGSNSVGVIRPSSEIHSNLAELTGKAASSEQTSKPSAGTLEPILKLDASTGLTPRS